MKKRVWLAASVLAFATTASAQTCNNPQGVYGMFSAIANAMSLELGRLQPLQDLEIVGEKLALTPVAQARCSLRPGGCNVMRGLLSMQNDEVASYFDPNLFSPVIFRQRLVIQYQRQQIAALRPLTDPNRAWAPPHHLKGDGGADLGGCAIHFLYKVSSDSAAAVTPAHLCSQLIFAGSQGMMSGNICVSDNPNLDMRVDSNASGSFDMAIDPIESLANLTSETLAASTVIESCWYVDGTGSAQGLACDCNGGSGTLQPAGQGTNVYTCR